MRQPPDKSWSQHPGANAPRLAQILHLKTSVLGKGFLRALPLTYEQTEH